MVLDTTKETICINQIVGQKNDIIEVESDVIVNDIKPDILSSISVSGTVCIYKKEVLDGKIKLDGGINAYIIYLADDEQGSVRSLNTTLDFSKMIDFNNCRSGMELDENIRIKNIECRVLNGRKVSVKAFLEVNASIYSNDNIEIIKDINSIEGIQVLNDNLEVNSLVGNGTTKLYAKDNVSIDNIDNLAEILRADVDIVNKDIKISYNKVLCKADAQVKIMYLTEDNMIKTTSNQIPIMGFIDIPNVSEDNICDTRYKLRNLITKPNVAEEHSIYVEAEVELTCSVYEKKRVDIIQDLYSPIENLNFSKREVRALVNKDSAVENYTMQEQLSVPEIQNNRIYDVCPKATISKADCKNGRISYEGEVELEFLYEAENSSRFDVKVMKLPFEFSANNSNIEETSNVETNIAINNQDFVVLNDGYIEAKIDLGFEINVLRNERLNIINEIDVEASKQCNEYSMIIYFVKEGDTLWSIAKKFGSTIQDIAKANDIEDTNKINTGMQLFIPRYCNRKTA